MIRLVVVLLALPLAAHAETCRFTGTTSHDGRVIIRTDTAQLHDIFTLDITAEFTVRAWMTDYRYLGQEITTWSIGRGREMTLRSIAVNQRSLANGSIKRQQWDVFTRNGERLEGSRVQAKSLADFRQRHPGFLSHWSPAGFGLPWLADFPLAGAERRPDLDLPAGVVQTPLASAFFWSRFLPPGGGAISLVLPSFKRDKQLSLGFGDATRGDGWNRWSTLLLHPALETRPPSVATVWVSSDHHLLQLAFNVHTRWTSGEATLRAEGCQGVQIATD